MGWGFRLVHDWDSEGCCCSCPFVYLHAELAQKLISAPNNTGKEAEEVTLTGTRDTIIRWGGGRGGDRVGVTEWG